MLVRGDIIHKQDDFAQTTRLGLKFQSFYACARESLLIP